MAGFDRRIILIGLLTIAESLRANFGTLLSVTQGCQIATAIGLLFLGRPSDILAE